MLYRELLVDCIPYLKPENIYLSFSKMTTTHVLAPVSSMSAKVIYSFLLSLFFFGVKLSPILKVASKERKPRKQPYATAVSSSTAIATSKKDQPHATTSSSVGTINNQPTTLSARGTHPQKHVRNRSIPTLATILQISTPSSASISPAISISGSNSSTMPTPPTIVPSRNYPVVKVGLYGFSKSLHPSAMSTSYFMYAAPEVCIDNVDSFSNVR